MLDLNDLRLFALVAEHGGFAAANRATGVPVQTLSKRVAELERRAGVRLIQRTSRSFAVTELGREMQRRAAAMLVEAEGAAAVLEGRLAEPSGLVRITASAPTTRRLLAPLLPRVALAYPKIRLSLHVTDRFVDLVQEGFDIAVRDHGAPLPDSGLAQRRVRTEAFWLVAAPAFLAGRALRTPDDFDGIDGLTTAPDAVRWRLAGPEGAEATVRLAPRYCADEASALLEAAAAGLGIARLPASLCAGSIAAGRLVRALPDWTAGEIVTSLLFPHPRGRLPSVRVVADMIAAEAR